MILMRWADVAVFAPEAMNPDIRFEVGGRTFRIEPPTEKAAIEVFELGKEPRHVYWMKVTASDSVDREKLVKAWSHLILLCGGKADPF